MNFITLRTASILFCIYGHFHIADGAARRQALELAFELQLGRTLDLFSDMHMVAIGDIALAVGDALTYAEPLLQALGKLIGGGIPGGCRTANNRYFSGGFPLDALIVHVLHHTQGKGLCGGIGMALAGHIFAAFIQARIAQADGGVAAVQQLINGLAFLQAGQSAVLPQMGAASDRVPLRRLWRYCKARWHSSRRSSKIFQNLSGSPPEDRATSGRLMVTTP